MEVRLNNGLRLQLQPPNSIAMLKKELARAVEQKEKETGKDLQAPPVRDFAWQKAAYNETGMTFINYLFLAQQEQKDYMARIQFKGGKKNIQKGMTTFDASDVNGFIFQGAPDDKVNGYTCTVYDKNSDLFQQVVIHHPDGDISAKMELVKSILGSWRYAITEFITGQELAIKINQAAGKQPWYKIVVIKPKPAEEQGPQPAPKIGPQPNPENR